MTTWTFKGLIACVVALSVAGCDENYAPPLTSAALARGEVLLVAPSGFCIDRRSLGDSFALMARCDTLGSRNTFKAPLAVITATTIAVEGDDAIVVTDTKQEKVLAREERGDITLLRVHGRPPTDQMRDVYWRGAGLIGNHIVGLAVYEAEGGDELEKIAPKLLEQTLKRSHTRRVTTDLVKLDNSATSTGN